MFGLGFYYLQTLIFVTSSRMRGELNCTTWDPKTCPIWIIVGYHYINTAIALFGVVSNFFIILVLSKNPFQRPPFNYMLGIAVQDLFVCILSVPVGFLWCIKGSTLGNLVIEFYIWFIFHPFANALATSSIWSTLALSAERLVVIKWPLHARVYPAKIVVILLVILAVLLHVPLFLTHVFSQEKNDFIYTEFSTSHGYVIYGWIRATLCKFIPILAITSANIALATVVRRSRRTHCMAAPRDIAITGNPGQAPTGEKTASDRAASSGLMMLFSICLVYVVCHLQAPFLQTAVIRSIYGECALYREQFVFFKMMSNIIELVSYASNIVPYCLFSRCFKTTLHRILHFQKLPCR